MTQPLEAVVSTDEVRIANAVSALDAWLDTMRSRSGYGGPVAHWWQQCLLFTGAALDWRYEGIVLGYLEIYRKTGDIHWLNKARRAGDDLVYGQLADGHFRNSSFELNPYAGGTPHEAACDLALLELAAVLRAHADECAENYFGAARRNLIDCQLRRLWDPERRLLRDGTAGFSFVPNKAATFVLALGRLDDLTEMSARLMDRFGRPTLDAILDHQVSGGELDGAILQNTYLGRKVGKIFPFYVARCIPALLDGHRRFEDKRFWDAAHRAGRFLLRYRAADGSFSQLLYLHGAIPRAPRWVAGSGEILLALSLLESEEIGQRDVFGPSLSWLLSQQSSMGGFRTADGFAFWSRSARHTGAPDFKDLLPVVGWNDKAFHYLATRLPNSVALPTVSPRPYTDDCTVDREPATFTECSTEISISMKGRIVYRWRKGEPWAFASMPSLMVK